MKTTIVYSEGLDWPPFFRSRFIERDLVSRLTKLRGVKAKSFHWLLGIGPTDLPPGLVVGIGHSFGSPAILSWARRFEKPIDLLVTLDPRLYGQPYVKPDNVSIMVNFYQTGFMRGYPVKGADEEYVVENFGHTQIPGMPAVYSLISSFIKEHT